MIRFFVTATGTAAAVPILLSAMHRQGFIAQLPTFLIETTVVVTLFTFIIFVYLYRSRKPEFFVQLYLLSMVVKLIAFFAYNLVMILDDRLAAVPNVMYFLLLYFIFTALETGFLYRRISDRP